MNKTLHSDSKLTGGSFSSPNLCSCSGVGHQLLLQTTPSDVESPIKSVQFIQLSWHSEVCLPEAVLRCGSRAPDTG